ncbi:MAG: glycoside hydrolase family 20 zincin-like fold domain-containing protein, partial [Candidatus Izemoplasmatales bacterium]
MMILPKPRKIIPTDGAFLVPSLWKIALIENDNLSNVVLDILFDWQKASLSEANLILGISRTILPIEGYRLSISPTKIIVEGADRLGVLHGLATLKQLDCHPTIDCQIIFDDPELPVRG